MKKSGNFRGKKHGSKLWFYVLLSGFILIAFLALQHPKIKQTAQNLDPTLYTVKTFYDGDTIGVDMNGKEEKVRFIGIDTPETHKPNTPPQCYGQQASDRMKQLIGTQKVRLENDYTNTNRDRYDRLLRYVYLPDGTFLNQKQVQEGYAFAYTGFPFQMKKEFLKFEKEAKDKNLGLWANCQIIQKDGFIHTNDVK